MFTSNFRYYLVNAVGMDDKDFEKFDTDLGLVLAVLKYAKVDGGVNKIRDFENKLKKLSPAGAELICAATGMTLTEIQAKFPSYAKDTEEGGTPMCEFWTDLFNQIEESDEMLLSGVLTVMKNQSCDAEQAMSYLGYKEKNRPRIRKLLKKVGVSAGAAF